MGIFQQIKRRFRKAPIERPLDWSTERKAVYIYRRGNPGTGGLARAIFDTPEVNDIIIIVEYLDRFAMEIMVSGGIPKFIAEAILHNKSLGSLTLGNQTVSVELGGIPYAIKFTSLYWLEDYCG